jgi:hypothetical protein
MQSAYDPGRARDSLACGSKEEPFFFVHCCSEAATMNETVYPGRNVFFVRSGGIVARTNEKTSPSALPEPALSAVEWGENRQSRSPPHNGKEITIFFRCFGGKAAKTPERTVSFLAAAGQKRRAQAPLRKRKSLAA